MAFLLIVSIGVLRCDIHEYLIYIFWAVASCKLSKLTTSFLPSDKENHRWGRLAVREFNAQIRQEQVIV
jgi:hypothetical protein